MNLLWLYNTQENHEAAKRLLKKYTVHPDSYKDAEDYYDYFADVMICALCDSMSGVGWYDLEFRLKKYNEEHSPASRTALISGMKYGRMVYLSGRPEVKGKPGKPVMCSVNGPDGDDSVLAMPLYTSKMEKDIIVADASRHWADYRTIAKICRKAGVDCIYPNPQSSEIVFSLEDVDDTMGQLDGSLDFIRKLKRNGLNGEDFFELLLMTFQENCVKCKYGGKIITGALFADRESDDMAVSIYNPRTDKEYNMPVSAIKWIREIDRSEI